MNLQSTVIPAVRAFVLRVKLCREPTENRPYAACTTTTLIEKRRHPQAFWRICASTGFLQQCWTHADDQDPPSRRFSSWLGQALCLMSLYTGARAT